MRDRFVERINRQVILGTQDLADEARGGLLFESNFLVGAEAGVDHQHDVDRLLGFRLENFDFLLYPFFKELEGFDGQIGRGAIVVVEHADEDVDEIDADANAIALGGVGGVRIGVVVIFVYRLGIRLAVGRWIGRFGFVCFGFFFGPGWAIGIGIVLRNRGTAGK